MISFLLSLYRKQLFMKVRYKRERSTAGLCFCRILRSVYKELHADHETGAADNK